jgi:hypothetical protein
MGRAGDGREGEVQAPSREQALGQGGARTGGTPAGHAPMREKLGWGGEAGARPGEHQRRARDRGRGSSAASHGSRAGARPARGARRDAGERWGGGGGERTARGGEPLGREENAGRERRWGPGAGDGGAPLEMIRKKRRENSEQGAAG